MLLLANLTEIIYASSHVTSCYALRRPISPMIHGIKPTDRMAHLSSSVSLLFSWRVLFILLISMDGIRIRTDDLLSTSFWEKDSEVLRNRRIQENKGFGLNILFIFL